MSRIFLPRTYVSSDAPTPVGPTIPGEMFNPDPEANRDQNGIQRQLACLPDRQLVATIVGLGCPKAIAEQLVKHPAGRFQLVATWCLVKDAEEGRSVVHGGTGETISARELVDGIREQYLELRSMEAVHDNPLVEELR